MTDEITKLRDELTNEFTLRRAAELDRDAARQEAERYRKRKDEAYTERNQLVGLLARIAIGLHWNVGLGKHSPDPDPSWDPEWLTVVYIDTPLGQLSWHVHDRDAHLWGGLGTYTGTWDGHTTEEKYRRVRELSTEHATQAVIQHANVGVQVAVLSMLDMLADAGLLARSSAFVSLRATTLQRRDAALRAVGIDPATHDARVEQRLKEQEKKA